MSRRNGFLAAIRASWLTDAIDYADMVAALKRCWIVVTDSGGLQEEAPALGKPVLVLRNTTERPEAVRAGAVRVVGTNAAAVSSAISQLCDDPAALRPHVRPGFPLWRWPGGEADRRRDACATGASRFQRCRRPRPLQRFAMPHPKRQGAQTRRSDARSICRTREAEELKDDRCLT